MRIAVLSAALVMCAPGCRTGQARDVELHRKVDAITARIGAIEERLGDPSEEDEPADDELNAKLDYLMYKLEAIEKKVDARGGATGGVAGTGTARPRAPEPDPATVYSVDIAGDPYRGVEHAKVTIVMGTEFA